MIKNFYNDIYIHGGQVFETYEEYIEYLKKPPSPSYISWADQWLTENMLLRGETVIRPRFPCKENAKYEEWKIVFEKYLTEPQFVVGFSLGGLFLAKYLSENSNPLIKHAFLVAPPSSLPGWEVTNTDFSAPATLFFSQDDKIVPFNTAEFYEGLPQVHLNGVNHFFCEDFPQLLEVYDSVSQKTE